MAYAAGSELPGDVQLVTGAIGGNRECFGALANRYWSTAVALAFSRISDRSQAEDVAQESFVRAYRHLAELRDPSRFAGWLAKIVIQQSVDYVRVSKRRLPVEAADVPRQELAVTSSASDTLGLSLEQQRLIRNAVRRLPEKWREVVVLRFIAGLSTEQIASQLGRRSGTVRVWLHRAYRKLRADLAPLAEEVRSP